MNARNIEQATIDAATKHQAQGGRLLGTLLVIHFQGCEVPVQQAEDAAKQAGLDVTDLPAIRDRSAISKALHELGITPSASHGSRSTKKAAQVTVAGSCLRYSRASHSKAVVYSIREEHVRLDQGTTPIIEDRGEVQAVTYDSDARAMTLSTELMKQDIIDSFAKWKGAYSSNSVRMFVGRVLDRAQAVKFAGSTWFVPSSDEATRIINGVRAFARAITGCTFTAVVVVDEPGGREDLVFSARESVAAEFAALAKRLEDNRKRREDGVKVKGATVQKIIDEGRELREKLRTLASLLSMETRTVNEQLDQLDQDVRKFLEDC